MATTASHHVTGRFLAMDDGRPVHQTVRISVRQAGKSVVVDGDFYPPLSGEDAEMAASVVIEAAYLLVASGRKSDFWCNAAPCLMSVPASRGFEVVNQYLGQIRLETEFGGSVYTAKAPKGHGDEITHAFEEITRGNYEPAREYRLWID